MTKIEQVRELSTRLLLAIPEAAPDVAVIALVEAAVRVLRFTNGLGAAAACSELAQVVNEIGRAEAES